jgi:hypothetical protein
MEDDLDLIIKQSLADMAQATAMINFTTAQANFDMARFGEWRCDYYSQVLLFSNDFDNAERDIAAVFNEKA